MLRNIFTSQRQEINYFFDHLNYEMAERVFAEFLGCKGTIVFSGTGKSGIIADKLAKTLVSTGTKSTFLPPSNALHGDIGIVDHTDLVVLLSKSGRGEEILRLASILKRRGIRTLAWVSIENSPLEKIADLTICLPFQREICPFDLAPTTSTAVQLIFGDVLAVGLMRAKKFSLDQYAFNHPGGAIGKLIAERVEDVMVQGEEIPVALPEAFLKDVLVELSKKRCGCLVITSDGKRVEGIFTDGDLRRSLERFGEKALSMQMVQLMSPNFLYTEPDTLTSKALEMMECGEKKVMMLIVLKEGVLKGLVHIHHILSHTNAHAL